MSDISKDVVRNRPRSIVVVLRSTERGEREKNDVIRPADPNLPLTPVPHNTFYSSRSQYNI